MKLEYEKGKSITFDVHDRNFFMGGSPTKKWKIFRSFKRFKSGKTFSELEEHVYGEEGIHIFLDGKLIKAKDISIYIMENRESILNECSYIKGSLLYEQMQTYKIDIGVNRLIEEITNGFFQIESRLQKDFRHISDRIVPNIHPINYQQLLKNHLSISYKENQENLSLDMMDSNQLLDEYCRLLRGEMNRTGKESWLILKNIENFLSKEDIRKMVKEFEKISLETKQLKVFFLSDRSLDLDYLPEDIEKTIILGEIEEQLPPYTELLRSIQLRYPEEYVGCQKVLLKRLYRIFPYLGTTISDPLLFPKDMVLFKILTELSGNNWDCPKMTIEELTPFEKAFLTKKDRS